MVTKAEAPALTETAVLRVTCDKPANAFHFACDEKGLSKQIISSYGWRLLTAAKCEDQFTGCLKVNASAKAQFLQISLRVFSSTALQSMVQSPRWTG